MTTLHETWKFLCTIPPRSLRFSFELSPIVCWFRDFLEKSGKPFCFPSSLTDGAYPTYASVPRFMAGNSSMRLRKVENTTFSRFIPFSPATMHKIVWLAGQKWAREVRKDSTDKDEGNHFRQDYYSSFRFALKIRLTTHSCVSGVVLVYIRCSVVQFNDHVYLLKLTICRDRMQN